MPSAPARAASKRPLGPSGQASKRRVAGPLTAGPLKRSASSSSTDSGREWGAAAKRRRHDVVSDEALLCSATHQFGLVGAPDYNPKGERLRQLLERLPAGSGPVALFVEPSSVDAVEAIVRQHRGEASREHRARPVLPTPCRALAQGRVRGTQRRGEAAPEAHFELHMVISTGASSEVPQEVAGCQYVINYDPPATGRQYLDRLACLTAGSGHPGARSFAVAYTLLEERQLASRRGREIRALIRRARRHAIKNEDLGGAVKAAEFDSALQQLDPGEDGGDDTTGQEGEGSEEDEGCGCMHCKGRSIGCATYHTAPGAVAGPPLVEVMRVPLHALRDLDNVAPLMAPRLPGHACTLICLHNLNCHTPWDGAEHLFALPPGMGSMRVVMVLADDCSWHDYPDVGSFCGGVAWIDILDVASMDRTDALIAKLVEHETNLLGGRSERLFLMGMSQGGAQSMLRFLRSERRLGGWLGAVCHAPTAPHMPRGADPLLGEDRPRANCDQPMRLLAGEVDSMFPSPFVLRDVERLRKVGGFTDVQVEVHAGLRHEGPSAEVEAEERGEPVKRGPPQELLFLQRHLPLMLRAASAGEDPAQ